MDLFEHAARAAKQHGMAQAAENAAPGWADAMYDVLVEVARRQRQLTSDDVFDLAEVRGLPATHDLRAFGPVMLRAARAGLIRKADCAAVPSRRVSLHASPRTVWESLL